MGWGCRGGGSGGGSGGVEVVEMGESGSRGCRGGGSVVWSRNRGGGVWGLM